ncbi:TonB family protein [Brevundimonas mediterranea]|uniref:TonB family protein n=1 Tax=Brevundimonas mediterranea TaxID=74329 RepID=A0A7W6A2E5_9CAUL|nr:TonB family protein [Brevundimonas mediterranea]MBB3871998.1 TonB family protein [Brevundimonas mediterranea]
MRALQTALCILAAGAVTTAGSAKADQRPQDVGPTPPTPSPISVRSGALVGPAQSVENTILQLPQAEATCEGLAVQPLYSEALPAQPSARRGVSDAETILAFSVASDGRTMDIRPADAAPAAFDTLQAGLAAWRFSAQARKDCRLTIRWRSVRLDEAEVPDLLNYFAVTRTTGALRDAVAKRLGGQGADCGDRFGGRRPDTVVFPDFEKGRKPSPGGRSWSVTRWNIDADGRATDVETLGSSGDVDLDSEARRAAAETRMQPGPARTGCVYNLYRSGETLAAPPLTPEDQREDPLQQCPPAVADRFSVRANPVFPTVFNERSIEGWALIRFDIAPWGQIGNVSVIEAQPAAAFGVDALRLVQSSQATPGFEAGVRCVVPVRYKLRDETAAPDVDQN